MGSQVQVFDMVSTIKNIVESSPGSSVATVSGGLRTEGKFKKNSPERPLVSVVMVVFNNASSIEESLFSVFFQDYSNVELIVIDGGSTDGTLDVIKKYEQYIDLWLSEKDAGIYDAMNKGLRILSGEYIHFLNSDDHYIDRKVISRVVNFFRSKKSGIIRCDTVMFSKKYGHGWIRKSDVSKYYFLFKGIPQQSFFYSRQVFREVGEFNPDLKIAADLDHYLNAWRKHNVKVDYFNGPLIVFNIGATSSDMGKLNRERDLILKKYFGKWRRRILGGGFFKNKFANNDLNRRKITVWEKMVNRIGF